MSNLEKPANGAKVSSVKTMTNTLPRWVCDEILRELATSFSGSIELHIKEGQILGLKQVRVVRGPAAKTETTM